MISVATYNNRGEWTGFYTVFHGRMDLVIDEIIKAGYEQKDSYYLHPIKKSKVYIEQK